MVLPLLALLRADLPPGGEVALDPARLALYGPADAATLERVPVDGPGFDRAIRVTTRTKPANDWELGFAANSDLPVKTGDVLHLRFWARTVAGGQPESGAGRITFDYQKDAPEWEKSVTQTFDPGREWTRYDVPFQAKRDIPAGRANVSFRIGYAPQTVEIGGLTLLKYGDRVALKDLPRTSSRYAGDEANAPWRRAALARIERIRKGPLVVRVTDARGRPVPNARVSWRMTRQAFSWGTAIPADLLVKTDAEGDLFRRLLAENFNTVAFENHLKWPFWETWARPDAEKALDWLAAQKPRYRVRGHNVLWPGWGNLPEDLRAKKDDRAALTKRVDDHIREIMTATRGKVDEWDAVNETFAQHDLLDALGCDRLPEWFRAIHAVDPKPRLVLNDYPTLDGGLTNDPHLEHFATQIRTLLAAKAPLGAIGFQCHFGSTVVPPERVLKGLDRFGRFGIPIVITEFDVDTQDEDLQARYTRDLLTAAFSHPAVDGFTIWGFLEGRVWLPNSAMFRRDGSAKPSGRVWRDLVRGAWWTNASGRTTARGEARARGFYGDYEVTIRTPRGVRRLPYRLRPGGRPLVASVSDR